MDRDNRENTGGGISSFIRGLFKDTSHREQNKGTYTFALNAVKNTDQGDNTTRSNEESNEICANLPGGYIIIEKVYAGDNRIILFLVNPENNSSEIGIVNTTTCLYETHVNDSNSVEKDKLNFKITRQISAVYRLRKGCEDTVYWVSVDEVPRYYNFSTPEQFKNQNNNWVAEKFTLIKTYTKIPEFQNVEVQEFGGNIPAGSYNFVIQYLDESLNLTEVASVSPTVKIYNDSLSKSFPNINGSINSEEDYIAFPNTGKSIKIEIGNLDTNLYYYRIGVVESNNGSGQISSIKFSDVISTSNSTYYYTGDNFDIPGTREELLQVREVIESAETIVQLENRLILGNTKGKQVNYCILQRYASKIKVDCVTKTIRLNNIEDPSNQRNPIYEFNNGIGYMPGEIYSLGVSYLFEDMHLSPVFHIAGRTAMDEGVVFSPQVDSNGDYITYPMSIDNEIEQRYVNTNNCPGGNFWGTNYNNEPLTGKKVRHHRFPLRRDIGVPLIRNEFQTPQQYNYYQLSVTLAGNLKLPIDCPSATPDCGTDIYHTFTLKVSFEAGGIPHTMFLDIDPTAYANNVDDSFNIQETVFSGIFDSNIFTNIELEMTDLDNIYKPVQSSVTDLYFNGNPTITDSVVTSLQTSQEEIVSTDILGLRISNVEIPEDIGGKKIIGYYIVRNERTEFDKTILDSAVMFPTLGHQKYTSHGLLQPETSGPGVTRTDKKIWSMLHPEFKFNNREYVNYDEIIVEGQYMIKERLYSKVLINDISKGSSLPEKFHKDDDDAKDADGTPGSRGLDGWCLDIIIRDNLVSYSPTYTSSFDIEKEKINDIFYLDALENKSLQGGSREVYNIASDNKIKILEFKEERQVSDSLRLPYVVLKKNNLSSYSNFRTLKYYKETVNPVYFSNNETSTYNIFNGDVYTSSMRYVNTMFWDNRIALRNTKSNVLKFVLGSILVVLGAVLSIFGGAGIPIAAAGGFIIAGAGVLTISSGIKKANYEKAYMEEYEKGLRSTALDSWVDKFYNYKPSNPLGFTPPVSSNNPYGADGPSDDSVQWIGEAVTNIWFESTVNMNLRNKFYRDTTPTFLDAPWKKETGNIRSVDLRTIKNRKYQYSNPSRYPVSTLERHLLNKLTIYKEEWNDNRMYLGLALGEYYHVNPDYTRREKEKIFFHLPMEYDCCSDCPEVFPHRFHYSEQSFQEELSDHYRIFLPNNYRDLDGESGKIKNMFTLGERLFILTEEGLWNVPSDHQERTTGQIVSFIGTGDYFAIPPRKIVEDISGNSAGTSHARGVLKTPYGVFFPNSNQSKIYSFNGENLRAISDLGMKSWFDNNMSLILEDSYIINQGSKYPFTDNPSNPSGSGFISVYDSLKKRIIVTKKDMKIKYPDNKARFTFCMRDGVKTVFENMDETIFFWENEGWFYEGIVDCRMKFTKRTPIEKLTEVAIQEPVRKVEADVHVILPEEPLTDNTFYQDALLKVEEWFNDLKFKEVFSNFSTIYFHYSQDNSRWLLKPFEAIENTYGGQGSLVDKEVIVINLLDNAYDNSEYSIGSFMVDPVLATQEYLSDLDNFKNIILPQFKSFKGIHIPIVTADNKNTQQFFLHSAAAMMGGIITPSTFYNTFITQNPGTPLKEEWDYIFKYLTEENIHFNDPLLNYQWGGIWGHGGDSYSSEGSEDAITNGLNNFVLASSTTTFNPRIYPTYSDIVLTKYIDGVPADEYEENNSWTMSFDVEEETWISWHSYMPYMYLSSPNKMFSVDHSTEKIWKHNQLGKYQTFYGKYNPFIMEFVSNDNPLITKIWDYIRIMTEAKKYKEDFEEFTEERFVTFNKAMFYNSRQNSGILNLVVKDTTGVDEEYLWDQVRNLNGDSIIIDRNERDWTLNSIRDIRTDYTQPMFKRKLVDLQDSYYIDKVLNENALDINKDWSEQEVFRDKYLTIRLIFDTFDDVKLILNYSLENESQSFR